MNATKIVLIFGLGICLFSCTKSDPRDLANEYCACFKEGLKDEKKMNECGDLAKKHQEILGKNVESSKIYAEEIIRCAVYEQNTGK